MSKYHAQKYSGYDSKKEYRRAQELKALQEAGEITDLREQVTYELIPPQYEVVMRTGKRGQALKPKRRCVERACNYIADFVYVRDGKTIVEDVKGYKKGQAYALFSIKRKLLLEKTGIRIQEV